MRKICIVTGTRAEYGLLYWLLKEIQDDPDLELLLMVTGMHLSPEFGLTYRKIEEDGFPITYKVEMLLSSDTPQGVAKAIGLGVIGFADALAACQPNLLVVLGDRFEMLAVCIAAMATRTPIAHIHGGELTEGLIDEPIRHAITKMSHLHFTATEEYRRRVIQLGEQPKYVYNVGGMAIDNIKKLQLLNRDEFERAIAFKLSKRNLLITFHPVTLEKQSSGNQFEELLCALDQCQDTHFIFTMPNADIDGRIIMRMVANYVTQNKDKAIAFTSMGQLLYLSTLQFMDGVVGNSSSGLVEVPCFRIGTVNIGDRQRGRIKAISVVDCRPDCEAIYSAIKKISSQGFRMQLRNLKNPYGEGGSAKKIKNIVKKIPLNDSLLKKPFFDLS